MSDEDRTSIDRSEVEPPGLAEEVERLVLENRALNEQVKLLVQTEQRLWESRNQLDQQLSLIEQSSAFAIRCLELTRSEDVLLLAARALQDHFNIDEVFVLQALLSSPESLWRLVPDEAPVEMKASSAVAETVVGLSIEADHKLTAALPRAEAEMMLEMGGAPAFQEGDRVVAVPMAVDHLDELAILVAVRRMSRRSSFFATELDDAAGPFLSLIQAGVVRVLHNLQLRRDVSARTAALERTNRKLRESLESLEQTQLQLVQASKMEAIGRLAGGVAHDFNNLLTIIGTSASLIQEALPSSSPSTEQVQQDVEEIKQASERGARLTRQLLAFSRQGESRPQLLDLNAAVDEVAPMLRRLIGEGISLETELDPSLPLIRADLGHVEQILLNLAGNAADAMPMGGSLILRTRTAGLPHGSWATLTVEDNGVGMDPSTLSRVFEPFFTTKDVGAGTGMGLATVYGLIQQAGGDVHVESSPGHGSQFIVRLPGVDPASLEEDEDRPPVVLVVEDEPRIRKLVHRVLKKEGISVLQAANAAEALELLNEQRTAVHLMLTDVIMPGQSGVTLADAARRGRPDLNVLFMSGYPGEKLSAHGLFTASGTYLSKPFSPAELVRMVRRALPEEVRASF